jgi:hypothetical protein
MAAPTPISVSPTGRHFLAADGSPFFWLGDTQWNLWRCHSTDEAEAILRDRAAKGFTVVQVMLCGWGMGLDNDPVFKVPAGAAHGEAYPERDPLRPSETYFRHVDEVVDIAERVGLVLVVGLDHPRLELGTPVNARAWGRQVGARYQSRTNLVWSPSYCIPDAVHLPVIREIAAGLREGGGSHLITVHPDPANPYCTSGIAHAEPWLDFHSIQTWARYDCIREAVDADYHRLPPKPVVMAEGAYEGGAEYGFPITPHLLRKQAWWSFVSGAHHSYGHNDNWQVPPTWRQSLEAPGARQMGVCRSVLSRVRWWDLVPDQSLIEGDAGGGATLSVAARSSAGEWVMVYVAEPRALTVRLDGVLAAGAARASWVDPRNGAELAGGRVSCAGRYEGETPRGLEDALLLIRPA